MLSATMLNAHFDGKNIVLDEKYSLKRGVKIIVTVLPERSEDSDEKDFLSLSLSNLERAYGDNEPEYNFNMIRDPNELYERR